MTNRELMDAAAHTKKWNYRTRYEIMMEWADNHQGRCTLGEFIDEIAKAKPQCVGVAPPDATTAAAITTAAQQASLAQIEAFFSKDLTERPLASLQMLNGYPVTEVIVPAETYSNWQATLDGQVAIAGAEPGQIVAGCYVVLSDKSKVALAVTRGDAENDFYADVFIIPRAELPPMSAAPRKSIAGLFEFRYPSGMQHTVRFRPDTPET